MKRLPALLIASGLLAGCANQVQTSSGTDYLARYAGARAPVPAAGDTPAGRVPYSGADGTRSATSIPASHDGAGRVAATPPAVWIDPEIRAAASVEPALKLPARFGLARIADGRMTAIPEAEAALWRAAAAKHAQFGEFVAISPLLAAFAVDSQEPGALRGPRRDVADIVRRIRLGAARQHVDAVLVYEVGASASSDWTWLALADLTIVGGAFLPTRSLAAAGRAEALLIDVRNGYPYGSASARADLSEFFPSWGSDLRTGQIRDAVSYKVVQNLVPEVEAMFRTVLEAAIKRRPS